MRLYSFTNSHYLNPLQCGLQTAHLVAELFLKYSNHKQNMVEYWAATEKTIIILNGGNEEELHKIYDKLKSFKFPCAKFAESKEALNGALTAVGLIVPDGIYKYSSEEAPFVLDEKDLELHQLIKSKRLA